MAEKALFRDLEDDFDSLLRDFLKNPPSEKDLLERGETIFKQIEVIARKSEALKRYRETRERMGKPKVRYVISPEFTYTLHSS